MIKVKLDKESISLIKDENKHQIESLEHQMEIYLNESEKEIKRIVYKFLSLGYSPLDVFVIIKMLK